MTAAVKILLLAQIGLLTACSEREAAPPIDPAHARLVSLHDVTTEMVVALGRGDRLVGIAAPVEISKQLDDAVARVPRVGDLESILALRPTAVVGLAVVAEQDPDLVQRIKDRGIEVYLPDPTDLRQVAELIGAVARRVDAVAEGEILAHKLLAAGVESAPALPRSPRVFVYDCCDPPFTAGGQAILTELIKRAGGINVFADLESDWTHVSWEQVIARAPDRIIVHSYSYDGQGDVAAKRKALHAISALRQLPIAVLPLGCSLGGLRSIEGLDRLRAFFREPT